MSKSKPPRKAYRPRPKILNTLQVASFMAAKPSKVDLDDVLQPIHAAHKALREGRASAAQFGLMAGCLDVAVAIEFKGVVRGLSGHLTAAEEALRQVYARANLADGWRPPAMYWDELEAVQTFIDLHEFQIRQLGRGEYAAACKRATGQNRSAGLKVHFVSDSAVKAMEVAA